LESLLVDCFDAIPLQLSCQEGPEDMLNRALSLSQLGDHESALGQIEEALRLSPTDVACLRGKATILYLAGRLEDALKFCRAALEVKQNDSGAWVTLGLCLEKLKQPSEAVSAYHRSLELDPTNHVAMV